MGVLKALIIATALFDLALCDDRVVNFEMNLPDVMNSFISIDQALRALQGGDTEMTSTNTMAENLMLKVQWKVYDYIARMLHLQRRKNEAIRPRVEYGPGAHKSEILQYPEKLFETKLKLLYKLKQKKEEQNKNR